MGKPSKWEVLVKDEILRYDDDKDEYDIVDIKDATVEDFEEASFEICVIRKDNKGGHNSWGWAGDDKIVLFEEADSRENLEWKIKIAEVIVKALNKEGL